MPKPYYTTMKGQAEYWIRRYAEDWLTVDQIHQATNLSRASIRSALAEMVINSILQKEGTGSTARYRYTEDAAERYRTHAVRI